MLEGGFEVVDDILGENVGMGQIVGVFKAFASEREADACRSQNLKSVYPLFVSALFLPSASRLPPVDLTGA